MRQTPNQFGVCLRNYKYEFFKLYVGAVESIPSLTVRKGNSFAGEHFIGEKFTCRLFFFRPVLGPILKGALSTPCMKESSERIRAVSGDTPQD